MDNLDDLKIDPVKKTIKAKIIFDRPDGKISYYDLLKKIKNDEIDPFSFLYIDNHNGDWFWAADVNDFEHIDKSYGFMDDGYKVFLTDKYDSLELLDLVFQLVPVTKESETPKYKATQSVIDMLETKFMDLNMEIDNCQGCMDGLDEAFAELNIYKELVKFLGGNIDAHIDELTEKWFKKVEAENKLKKDEQAMKDKVIKVLPFNILSLMNVDDTIRDVLWKQNDKINEICRVLQENKKNEK